MVLRRESMKRTEMIKRDEQRLSTLQMVFLQKPRRISRVARARNDKIRQRMENHYTTLNEKKKVPDVL